MRFRRAGLLSVVATAVLAITIGIYFTSAKLSYGARRSSAARDQSADLSSSQTASAVILEETQLAAIKVEQVDKHLFANEREAVGSIDFDEDVSVVQAESALIGAAATVEVAKKELARVKDLYAANVGVSQRELEQAISDQQTAAAALKAARDAVRILGKTDAEIDRMIGEGRIEPTLATRVAIANVSESDVSLVHVGQPVTMKVMAYPDRIFHGKVSKIYAVVDPNTHRTKIRASVADPGNELRPGMLANVIIRVQEPLETVAIPANGVVREGDGTMTVWVTTDRHHFLQRTVKVGLQREGWDQIVDGLKPGELVVTDGGIFLSNMLEAHPSD